MTKAKLLLIVPLLGALAACATMSPEEKVRDRLIDAGLRPRLAECMAERLVDRLSYSQLRELGRLARLPDRDVGRMTVDEFLFRLRALEDPEIIEVVGRAGIGCAIAG